MAKEVSNTPRPPTPLPPRLGRKMLVTKTASAEKCSFEVKVMARADGYAMVRRPGCIPFVCRDSDLSELV